MSEVKIDREDLGANLHTALRKLCDSTPTSLAWNLFYCLPPEIWNAYLDCVFEGAEKATQSTLGEAVKQSSIGFRDWMSDPAGDSRFSRKETYTVKATKKTQDTAGSWAQTLTCTFKLFDADDWQAYIGFLRRN